MRLHLHVGHGKTGSSYLQSWWALNRSELWRVDRLYYPVADSDQRALSGRFTMGNGVLLDQALKVSHQPQLLSQFWSDVLPKQQDPDPKGVLFSAERWARHLPMQLEDLIRVADAGGCDQMTIWLLVRDPLDHAVSVYGQMVKRHGFSGSLQDWLEIYDFPRLLLHFLEVFLNQPNRISFRVDHYGHQRNNLENCLLDWLALPVNSKWQKPLSTVNRSLTQDEFLMMRFLNERLGESASVVGELLVDRLPHLKPARLQPSHDALKRFEERWSPTVEQINLYLPDSVQLCCSGSTVISSRDQEQHQKLICLLPEQLECLLDGLEREAAR